VANAMRGNPVKAPDLKINEVADGYIVYQPTGIGFIISIRPLRWCWSYAMAAMPKPICPTSCSWLGTCQRRRSRKWRSA